MKDSSVREGAVLVDRCTKDWVVPLRSITKSSRVRRKEPDNEAWSFMGM